MENLTLDPVDRGAVAAGSGGSSSRGAATPSAAMAPRRRTPGRWRRIPRTTLPPAAQAKASALPPAAQAKAPSFDFQMRPAPARERTWDTPVSVMRPFLGSVAPMVIVTHKGSAVDKEVRRQRNQSMVEKARLLEAEDESLCATEEEKVAFRAFKVKFAAHYRSIATTKEEDLVLNYRPPSDTREEHLTAEEMEMEAIRSGWLVCPQAHHFATLALAHYNKKKTHKYELAKVLLAKCFTEADNTTFGHVNFTATLQQSTSKRLFFAELMLIPELQAYDDAEPMRVLHVCTIDDSCFGGCHEMERDIKEPVRKNMDYDRCHACSNRIKHPRGAQFIAGHNRTRMPYFSAFAWTYRSQ